MASNLDTMIAELTAQATELAGRAYDWLYEHFLTPDRLIELGVLIGILVFVRLVRRPLARPFARFETTDWWPNALKRPEVAGFAATGLVILLIFSAVTALSASMGTLYVLPTIGSLLFAWLVIRLVTIAIPNRQVARTVAPLAWTVAALNILGFLTPILDVLDGAILPIGDASISVLDLLRGAITLAALMWGALALSELLEKRLQSSDVLPASLGVLTAKSIRILLLVFAFLIAMDSAGIDLTVLAVFGGALGVGLGFGLQKVVSNFISGLILLLDQSIKPGDVVEIEGTYGRINKLAARYTSVVTRDGTEYLIPNESMITENVVNWSHSDRLVRRRIPLQVSYESDLRKAMDLMVQAALREGRVLNSPAPKTLLKGFGDSGVDLELRVWIEDPQDGVANIASAIMLNIWDLFQENGIAFPYPQRVVTLKTPEKGDTVPNGF